MRTNRFILAAAAASSLGLAACETQPNYPTNAGYPTGSVGSSQPAYANSGRVSSIELVRGNTSGSSGISPVGTVIGAVVGGLVGHQIGEGRGNTAATVVGAAGGALAGNAIAKHNQETTQTQDMYRVGVRLDNGGSQTIDVPNSGDLRVGDRVRVDGNQISRY